MFDSLNGCNGSSSPRERVDLRYHGLAGSIETWEPLHLLLAEERRTIALDLPGHGESDKPRDFSYAPDSLRRVVAAALAARGVARAVWIGNSIGGQVALAAAIAGAPEVAALVLVNPTGFDDAAMTALLSRPDSIKARAGVARTASLLDAALQLMFADPDGAPARRLAELRARRSDSLDHADHARAVMHVAVAARNAPVRHSLDRVHVPALGVWGDRDRLLGEVTLERLSTIGAIVRIPNAGHMPQLEAPAEVHRAIEDFCARERL